MSELTNPNDLDSWASLRQHTAARIGLGRVGAAIPTAETLRFKLAHSRARDAVHAPFDPIDLAEKIKTLHPHVLTLQSRAADRAEYLCRPDLGRCLSLDSSACLDQRRNAACDLGLVVTDGLSPLAIGRHAMPFLATFLPLVSSMHIAPICVVQRGRVAIGDAIGHLLAVRIVVVLIGERPGLGSPDSMGIYLTHSPRPGLTDECRNCLSNIRPEGLGYAEAAEKLAWLFRESALRGFSGVQLKEGNPDALPPSNSAESYGSS